MVINNHRKHSTFALKHFMAGGCYTADAAYVLLFAQLEGLRMDMATGQAGVLRNQAKRMELLSTLADIKTGIEAIYVATGEIITDPKAEIELLKTQADLIEFEAAEKMFTINFEGTKREVVELEEMLATLKPLCKFWNDDILKMEQDMCQTEWAHELAGRAENMIMANAFGIPYDHFATMRQHPEFESVILPSIAATNDTLALANQTRDKRVIDNFLLNKTTVVDMIEGRTPAIENKINTTNIVQLHKGV
jgi:hypothetical protein